MTHGARHGTGHADAAKILSDVQDRLERLEEDRGGGTDQVQLFRNTTDTITLSDSHTITEGDAGGFVFGTSEWGFDEFGDQ